MTQSANLSVNSQILSPQLGALALGLGDGLLLQHWSEPLDNQSFALSHAELEHVL